VDETVNYLNSYVTEEGLFRISGSMLKIEKMRTKLDNGESLNISTDSPDYGPHEVAGLLKMFFRKLPEPLFSVKRYRAYLDIQADKHISDQEKLKVYRALLRSLPEGNRVVLQKLLELLNSVASNSKRNLMSTANLATTFGPSLLCCQEDAQQSAASDPQAIYFDVGLSISIITLMIDNYRALFEK